MKLSRIPFSSDFRCYSYLIPLYFTSAWREVAHADVKPKVYDSKQVLDLLYQAKAALVTDDASSTSSSEQLPSKSSGGIKKGIKGLFSQQSIKFSKSVKR